ncbi:similar to Saccharomyces cerevisiae YIL109C SEC24 Component of the Sec23p-Sec24p heterodimer of the COPII vesicle coat [Maudiozyma saulgeensis]|uniref:Similar to Saccharomyces cerevisiae YIL109C SEC24 Component of the Sec23p-Sec24p heterodimer of the COPII vesicle coat n=1 Tax=Maudiozyma saulgeensis TaxID=1789683 RepID=A0A1X7R988_9SACH|nr:similar to Saccharomyces cerevisiae YIL109C SEC24 Component of the Sec23p-Sec24p heterodimer of the COPII vesicle coat [Kazachstania saulgeensis]
MSHKHQRRVYPQQQYEASPAQPSAGMPGMGMQDQMYNAGVPQPQQFNQQFGVPVQQQQQQQFNQQLDQTTNAMGNMNMNAPNGMVDPNAMYQPQQQQPQQQQQQQQGYPQQGYPQQGYAPQYGQQGFAQPQEGFNPDKVPREHNELYPTDLLNDLPPPIAELSLPPPPLQIPPQKMLVPSEEANASSDFIRCTLNAVPKNNSLLKKTKLPLGLVIRPYQHLHDDNAPPPLDDSMLIVRCRRCRIYINPFVTFLSGGNKWRCNFCRLANEVPAKIDMDKFEAQMNRYERSALKCGVMEYLAPKEYTVRQPSPTVYVFILDVSQAAQKEGLLSTAVRTILDTLDELPNHDNRTRVSIMCVDNALHYFAIPSDDSNENTQMLDVCDIDEPYNPRPGNLVVSLTAARQNIEKLLGQIPQIFEGNILSKFALGPALKSAFELIRSTGGKIIVVSATLPNHGIGKLSPRNEKGVSNTQKETSQLLSCQDGFYKNFTIDCNKAQIGIDLFLASSGYVDFASLSNLARYTGGQTHMYPGFNAAIMADVTKFSTEFSRHLSMDTSTEAVLRARGSIGIRMQSFYGHFFNRQSDLLALSTLPRDQSYVFEMTMDDNLVMPYCYVQVAALLTLNNSERRIRVITVALPTTENIREVFASADQLAMTDFYTQKAVSKAMNNSIEEARELINKSVLDILNAYKKETISSNTPGGVPLQLCTNLRMFPLLMNSLKKHQALMPSVLPSDHRANALNYLESAPLKYLIKAIYPTIYALHEMADEAGLPGEDGSIVLPDPINDSMEFFAKYGLYLIDNGTELFLWIGGEAIPELVNDVFGQQSVYEIPVGKSELPVVEGSEFNEKVRNIINKIRQNDEVITYQVLYIIYGPVPNEIQNANTNSLRSLRMWALSNLVEDRSQIGEGYREYLQNMKSKLTK